MEEGNAAKPLPDDREEGELTPEEEETEENGGGDEAVEDSDEDSSGLQEESVFAGGAAPATISDTWHENAYVDAYRSLLSQTAETTTISVDGRAIPFTVQMPSGADDNSARDESAGPPPRKRSRRKGPTDGPSSEKGGSEDAPAAFLAAPPLPPTDPDLLRLLRAWYDAGFAAGLYAAAHPSG